MNFKQLRKIMKRKYDAVAKAALPDNFDDIAYETFERFSEGNDNGKETNEETREGN